MLIHTDEVARILHVSPETIRDWVKAGKNNLQCEKIGGRWKFPIKQFDRFLDVDAIAKRITGKNNQIESLTPNNSTEDDEWEI